MAANTCPACGHDTWSASPNGGGSCSRCGYVSGESSRCPHCGAMARTEGSGTSTVCAVCGGPRVPGGFGGDAAVTALKEQKKLLGDARLASFATIVQGMLATLATLIGLVIMPESIAGKVIVLAMAIVPLLFALRSRGKARTARNRALSAGERAWQAAAEDVAAKAKQGVTVAGLAKTLGIDEAHADRILTSLAVHDRTRIDVGDDAEVRYSAVPGAALRIGDADALLERGVDARHREDDEREAEGHATTREPAR